MAADPVYTTVPNIGAGITPASADTSMTAPTNATTVFTAGASGSRVDMIRIAQILTTTTPTVINIFLHDGSTYHFFDCIDAATQTISSTVRSSPGWLTYPYLVLPTGWTVRVTNTVAAGSGSTGATHKVVVIGENL